MLCPHLLQIPSLHVELRRILLMFFFRRLSKTEMRLRFAGSSPVVPCRFKGLMDPDKTCQGASLSSRYEKAPTSPHAWIDQRIAA